MMKRMLHAMLALLAATMLPGVGMAQIQTVDPNTAIDADLAPGAPASDNPAPPPPPPAQSTTAAPASDLPPPPPPADVKPTTPGYQKDDVIGAAEGVFGKGAEGLGAMIEKILGDQGDPIGYIAGREASGAIGIGFRYGSGTLTHKTEGERKVYWTGPSIGFDLGGNASRVFVLVYNVFDSEELFKRYPQVEGSAYVIGGFTATYLRRGDKVLIPIRLGVGWRLGINAGYMKFSKKGKLLPF